MAGDITNTYFGGNTASTNGGAIFRGTSTGDISMCDFISNSAVSDGGAIYDSHVEVSCQAPPVPHIWSSLPKGGWLVLVKVLISEVNERLLGPPPADLKLTEQLTESGHTTLLSASLPAKALPVACLETVFLPG